MIILVGLQPLSCFLPPLSWVSPLSWLLASQPAHSQTSPGSSKGLCLTQLELLGAISMTYVVIDSAFHWLLHILPLNIHSTQSIFICIELTLFPQTNFLYTRPSIPTVELWNAWLLGESVCVAVLQDWIGILQAFTSIEVHCYPQRHLKTQI